MPHIGRCVHWLDLVGSHQDLEADVLQCDRGQSECRYCVGEVVATEAGDGGGQRIA